MAGQPPPVILSSGVVTTMHDPQVGSDASRVTLRHNAPRLPDTASFAFGTGGLQSCRSRTMPLAFTTQQLIATQVFDQPSHKHKQLLECVACKQAGIHPAAIQPSTTRSWRYAQHHHAPNMHMRSKRR
jgi:hypothetical protein